MLREILPMNKLLRHAIAFSAAATMILSVSAGAAQAAQKTSQGDLWSVIRSDSRFSILERIVEGVGLQWRYQGADTRTVFAPTNEAFEMIPGGYQDMISPTNDSTKRNVQALLLYQIVSGRIDPAGLKPGATVKTTYQKGKVEIDRKGSDIRYGGDYGGTVTGDAVSASNGLVVPIDGVPIPSFSDVDPKQADGASAE
jgi:uncharacterized surface protein with fasciclin (FAS1) repeats